MWINDEDWSSGLFYVWILFWIVLAFWLRLEGAELYERVAAGGLDALLGSYLAYVESAAATDNLLKLLLNFFVVAALFLFVVVAALLLWIIDLSWRYYILEIPVGFGIALLTFPLAKLSTNVLLHLKAGLPRTKAPRSYEEKFREWAMAKPGDKKSIEYVKWVGEAPSRSMPRNAPNMDDYWRREFRLREGLEDPMVPAERKPMSEMQEKPLRDVLLPSADEIAAAAGSPITAHFMRKRLERQRRLLDEQVGMLGTIRRGYEEGVEIAKAQQDVGNVHEILEERELERRERVEGLRESREERARRRAELKLEHEIKTRELELRVLELEDRIKQRSKKEEYRKELSVAEELERHISSEAEFEEAVRQAKEDHRDNPEILRSIDDFVADRNKERLD